MARRKRQIIEDEDSDSSASDARDDFDDPNYDANDPDTRAERELFENPYGNKRRRKNGKEDAIYGVFADSDEDEGFSRTKNEKPAQRSDWTKAPSFVSGEKVELDKSLDVDETMGDAQVASSEGADDEVDDQSDGGSEEDQQEEEESSKPPTPQVQEEEEDEEVEEEKRPRLGGLGLGASKAGIGIGGSRGGIGSGSRTAKSGQSAPAFSGFSHSGTGMFRLSSVTETESATPPTAPSPDTITPADLDLPTNFGASRRPQRSFVRDASGSRSGTGTPKPVPLNASERVHFAKLTGTFGARMLERMGWQAGTGLGTEGEGIVAPVESKLRPKNMGLAFKGFKEKTEQSKAEARRRGEVVSEDEEADRPQKGRKPKGGEQKERSDAWKKPKKAKRRVEHKTYEEIIAEAGQEVPSGIGQIIDATGATPREVASLAEVSIASWTPTSDVTRLPELRHNLRLITEACKNDLDGLAREARALEERKKWIQQEDARLRRKVEEEAELIAKLQQVHLVVDDINTQAKQAALTYEASLDPFSADFEKLVGLYAGEFDRYRLDEVVVAAIAPVIRRMLTQWRPLEEPDAFVSSFRLWRHALKMTEPDEHPVQHVQTYGSSTVVSTAPVIEKPMTPYESLIWNAWLPKVRSCINNDWSPDAPQPAVRLYEAWSRYLPPFVRDNFFDQLVLPKVHKAVNDWNPRKHNVPLQTLVFPWLPHIGLRIEEVLDDARRKIKSLLRSWVVSEGVPKDLTVWKEVFDVGDWDAMLLKYIVPKLGARLRDNFRVNPRKQDMDPLKDVLLWEKLLRPSIFSQILETEFFPKWLDVLYIWLVQPSPSFEEVAQWYSFWKSTFPENVQIMPGVAQGFTRGLQLMNKAIELGPDAPAQLPKPDYHFGAAPKGTSSRQGTPKPRPSRTQEITFRTIVEDYAASHNLLFIPTGKAHEKSRMPLYRVSQTVDGKGGLLVYILDDAVWAPDGDDYRAISLENMVLRGTKASST